jgi:hypothetical protein
MIKHSQVESRVGMILRYGMPIAAVLNLALVGYGLLRFPTTLTATSNGVSGLAGVVVILAAYAPAVSRSMPHALNVGSGFGILAAVLFLVQFLYGYLAPLTEAQNAMLANITFGGLFILFFIAGTWTALRTSQIRQGLTAAVWSAMIGSIVWCGLLFITYYLFIGTAYETRQLVVDQTTADFQASGMNDLRAFIMQDYLGGGFFHLVLGPLAATVFGLSGSLIGKGIAGLANVLKTSRRSL